MFMVLNAVLITYAHCLDINLIGNRYKFLYFLKIQYKIKLKIVLVRKGSLAFFLHQS